jgi:hypothetical protein
MNKHTPGPWQVHETCHQMNFPDTTVCEIKYHGQEQSFFVGSPATNHGDAKATAKLIAAAPDLLQALEVLLGIIERGPKPYTASEKKELALAAIKKATE